jgi:hypothetical protein
MLMLQWQNGGMDPDWLLGLFSLEKLEAFYEPRLDTRCIVGWGGGTVVVSFRGTASKANAVTDAKVGGI